jgi:hypothetical protein
MREKRLARSKSSVAKANRLTLDIEAVVCGRTDVEIVALMSLFMAKAKLGGKMTTENVLGAGLWLLYGDRKRGAASGSSEWDQPVLENFSK